MVVLTVDGHVELVAHGTRSPTSRITEAVSRASKMCVLVEGAEGETSLDEINDRLAVWEAPQELDLIVGTFV